MGLVHGRNVLIPVPLSVPARLLLPLVVISVSCDGTGTPGDRPADPGPGEDPPAAVREAPETGAPNEAPSEALLVGEIPNGSPMPAAESAGGVPPYPEARVYNRSSRGRPGLLVFEAFSSDPPEEVSAFYNRHLPEWRHVTARDVNLWVREPDQASVSVGEWDYGNAFEGLPRFLREEARTVIGVAWRIDETSPPISGGGTTE